jgi:hypothetical protein
VAYRLETAETWLPKPLKWLKGTYLTNDNCKGSHRLPGLNPGKFLFYNHTYDSPPWQAEFL